MDRLNSIHRFIFYYLLSPFFIYKQKDKIMGYFSYDRVTNVDPLQTMIDKIKLEKTRIEINIYVDLYGIGGGRSTITFTEDITGLKHVFESVRTGDILTDSSFLTYSGEEDAILKSTNSLRDCLMKDVFFQENFDVEVVPVTKASETYPFDAYSLVLTSKEIGRKYDCSVETDVVDLNYIGYKTTSERSIRGNLYEIVKVDKPKEITLANNPNFVTFSNVNEGQRTQSARMSVVFLDNGSENRKLSKITIKITEIQSKKDHLFYGVYDVKDLTDNSFLVDKSKDGEIATAYNFRESLMRNAFFRNNYEIVINMVKKTENFLSGGNSVELISKGYGSQYDCRIEATYGGVSSVTTKVKDTILNINPDYVDITEEDDITLVMAYRQGGLKNLSAIYYKGKLELDENSEVTDFLIVKPEEGKYTEEEARIATLKNIRATMIKFPESETNQAFDITLNGSIGLVLKYKVTSPYQLQGIDSSPLLFNYVEIPEIIDGQIYNYQFRYILETFYQQSVGSDSIDDGLGDYKIELDVYTNNGLKWGEQSINIDLGGTYLTTLSKSYFGKPLWFELNTLLSKKSTYSPLFLTAFDQSGSKWIDPGTMSDYRFVARRTRQGNTQPIYMSDILYTINGYDYTLNDSHLGYGETEMKNYTLDLSQDFESKHLDSKVSPLTTNLSRTHLSGQKQYINYIIKRREEENSKPLELALLYKLYTQSGKLTDEVIDLQVDTRDMSVMNTTQLNLDRFLPIYNDKKVGQIDVCLITPITNNPTKKYVEVSDSISYRILPSALHTLHDFAFLNRLGGWDSMNFGGSTSNEFKVTSSTIFKTLQPQFKSYTEIESVSSKAVEEKLTIQTSPITREVVEWLREMSVSPAVYELSTRRYVLIDDMTLKYNSKDDLFQIDMKYHYSDVFNGRMK